MEENNYKKFVVQVPDEIIRNTYFNLSVYAFAIYARLCYLHFRSYNKEILELDHRKLMHKLYISDTRTLKKALNELVSHGIIKDKIKRLPTKGTIKLKLNLKPFESKKFTQLPTNIFSKVEFVGVIGLRLLFYYESYINRTDSIHNQFCFASQETIQKHLNLNKETIKKYNDTLEKTKLLRITKHKLECTYEYNDIDEIIFTKYNNHYFINLENI